MLRIDINSAHATRTEIPILETRWHEVLQEHSGRGGNGLHKLSKTPPTMQLDSGSLLTMNQTLHLLQFPSAFTCSSYSPISIPWNSLRDCSSFRASDSSLGHSRSTNGGSENSIRCSIWLDDGLLITMGYRGFDHEGLGSIRTCVSVSRICIALIYAGEVYLKSGSCFGDALLNRNTFPAWSQQSLCCPDTDHVALIPLGIC